MTTCPRCGAVKPAAVDVCIWCAAELGRDVRPGSAYAEGFGHPGPGLGPRWYPDGSTGPGVRPAGPNGEPPAPPPPGTRHAPGAVAGPAAPTGRTGRKAWPWLVTAAVAVLAVLAVLFGTGVLPVPGRGAAPAPPTSAPSAPTSPPPGSDPNTDPPGTSIGAADPAGLANGGTFRLAGLQLPATSMNPLDPGSYASPLGRDIDAFRAAFPIFVRFGADGRPAWDPAYVVGAEVLSAAPTRVRIDLNPKAVWGDGTPLQATDVAEVWRRGGSADTCARADVWSGVTDVRAGSSPQQVLVDYKGADGEWQRPFALVSAMRPEAARADAKAWQQPPAAWQSGPFLIEKASLRGGIPTVELGRNPVWWREKPRLDRLVLSSSRNAAARLSAGQVDAAEFASPGEFTAARGNGQVRLAPSGVRRQLVLNPRVEQPVRQAIQLALDRRAVALTGVAGLPEPVRLDNAVLLTNQVGYTAQTPGRNLDRARELMAGRAGPVKLRMLTSEASSAFYAGLPIEIANQLREIGIEVQIERVPFADYNRRQADGDFDLAASGWIDDQFVVSTAQGLYGPTGNDRKVVTDPAIPGLLERARGTTDAALRSKLLNEVDSSLQSQAIIIPLYQDQEVVITKPMLANYGAFGLASVDWTRVGYRS